MRQARCMKVIRSVLVAAKATSPMRIVHFCVQRDHLHLIIEADEREAFLSGIRGLTIQLSKRLNAALLLSGRLWADRYQAEELNSFSQLRQALVFVLNNRLWHSSRRGGQTKPAKTIDPCSSGLTFDGWRGIKAKALTLEPAVEEPRGFALRRGWRRHGLIAIDELPGGSFAEPPEG